MAWKRFLFVQLPAALAISAVLAEGAASVLSGVAPRRHDLDRLVAALDGEPLNAPVVLLGDSITQDVAKSYRLAKPGHIANLTTNMASGAVGAALLLRRYLERNAPPRMVVVAATGDFFAYTPEGKAAETWVTSVFRRPEERADLARFGLIRGEAWYPAALALEARLGEKVVGLSAPAAETMPAGTQQPGGAAPEMDPGPVGVAADIAARAKRSPAMSDSALWAMEEMCRLSARYGFTLTVLRAPQPESVSVMQGAALAALDGEVARATQGCRAVAFGDFNAENRFPDHAFRDSHHLRRPGWTAHYARLLADKIGVLSAAP